MKLEEMTKDQLVDLARKQEVEMLAARQPLADSFVAPGVTVDTPELQRFSHRPNWMQKDSWGGFVEYAVAIAHTARAVAAAYKQGASDGWLDGVNTVAPQPVAGELPPLPAGWIVRKDDDSTIAVQKHGVGGYAARHDADNIASSILHAFASDLLDSLPVQQPAAFPERDQSKPAEQQGVFRKFEVRRVDGSDAPGGKHHGCRYFVLDMDHDQNAAPALAAYAASCAVTHPNLSAELVAEFGQQPAAVVGQEPYGWVCQRIQQNGKVGDYWEYYDAKAASNLMGEAGLRANDSMTNWTPLYTAQVPAAGVQGYAELARQCAEYKDRAESAEKKLEYKALNVRLAALGDDEKPDSGRDAALLRNIISNAIYGYGCAVEDHNGVVDAIVRALAAHPANGAQAGAFSPTQEQFTEWCERYGMQPNVSREAFDDAASLYLVTPQKKEG